MKSELMDGLAQANHDCFLPEVSVCRQFSSFISRDLDALFPTSRFERVVAHPSIPAEDKLFARLPQRLSEYWSLDPPSYRASQADMTNTLGAPPLKELVIAVGAEGGWHRKDLDLLESRQFSAVHIGPRVLRTDTAVSENASDVYAYVSFD
jgi:16S rRNA (uracil1498-N3)-methyltransferase